MRWWVGGRMDMKPSLQLVHFLQISIVTPSSPFEWGEEVGQLGSGVTMTGLNFFAREYLSTF